MAGGSLLLHHRSVLLCALIDGIDRLIDFGKCGGLFAGGFDNRHDIAVDITNLRRDFLQRRSRLGNQTDAVFHLRARSIDEALDFLCSRCRALRQFAHFLRDDCETLARLTGTRRFHAGIQRKQIGLEGDLVDHADNVGNLA